MRLRPPLRKINWPGLVAGVLMLMLPFLGFWWIATAGEVSPPDDRPAAQIALSPFDIRTTVGSYEVRSHLVEFFLLAAKIGFLLGGAFLVLGSLSPPSWWSKHLVRFGVMRPFWSVIMLLIMVIVGTLLINLVVPGLMSSMARSLGGEEAGEVKTELNLPYFSGSTVAGVEAEGVSVRVPVTLALTGTFWFAVAVAGLGIASRVCHRRLAPER